MNLIVTMLLTLLLLTPILPLAAETPFSARTLANTWQFLAQMAESCEMQLQVYGRDGLVKPACQDFAKAFVYQIDVAKAQLPAFTTAIKALQASPAAADQRLLQEIMTDVQAAIAVVEKTVDHIAFLNTSGLK